MMELYNFEHGIGLHFYDIPSLIVLLVTVIILGVHFYMQKKREKEFEDEMDQDEFVTDVK